MQPATVSVVIPAYNSVRFLPEAIDSVLQQTYQDIEIIVVDDGSSDDTEAALAPYRAHIHYFRQPHAGASAARNQGIRMARGRYVAFLDSDDCWKPSKLDGQIAILGNDPEIALVCSDVEIVSEGGEALPTFLNDKPNASGRVFDLLLRSGFILTSSVVVRRDCLLQVGLFDESLPVSEDIDLWLRIALQWKVHVVPETTVIRRKRRDALSADLSRITICRVRVVNKLLNRAAELSPHSRGILLQEVSKAHWNLGYQCFLQNRRVETRSNMLVAWKYDRTRLSVWPFLLASYLPDKLLASLRMAKQKFR